MPLQMQDAIVKYSFDGVFTVFKDVLRGHTLLLGNDHTEESREPTSLKKQWLLKSCVTIKNDAMDIRMTIDEMFKQLGVQANSNMMKPFAYLAKIIELASLEEAKGMLDFILSYYGCFTEQKSWIVCKSVLTGLNWSIVGKEDNLRKKISDARGNLCDTLRNIIQFYGVEYC